MIINRRRLHPSAPELARPVQPRDERERRVERLRVGVGVRAGEVAGVAGDGVAQRQELDVRAWWGGLVDGMRDVSGQMYMRNRYYDPATGQFTQQDPIGLAGGLNSYGFAAGDPVSYSDPYGLSGCGKETRESAPWRCSFGYRTLRFFGVSEERADFIGQIGYGGALAAGGPGSGEGVRGIATAATGLAVQRFPRDYATRNTRNWSAEMASERDARNLARRRIGNNPVQVEPHKWRSQDGRWQYRAKPADVRDNHVHVEQLNPVTGEVIQNVHLRWR